MPVLEKKRPHHLFDIVSITLIWSPSRLDQHLLLDVFPKSIYHLFVRIAECMRCLCWMDYRVSQKPIHDCVAEVVMPSGFGESSHVEQQGHNLDFLPCIYVSTVHLLHCIALMVGFDQSTYAFDEDASTGQVCITFTGDLASTVSPNLGLILVGETADAEGVLFSVEILDERQV